MPCRHVLAQGIGGRAANCHVWRLCEARPAGYGVRHLWLSECTPPSARLPQRLLHGMPRQVDMRADRRRHRAPELPDARLRRSAFGARHQAPWKARPPQRRAPEAAPGAPQRWKAGRVAARAQRGGPGPHGVGDDVHTGVPTLLRARAKVDWLQPHHVLVQGRVLLHLRRRVPAASRPPQPRPRRGADPQPAGRAGTRPPAPRRRRHGGERRGHRDLLHDRPAAAHHRGGTRTPLGAADAALPALRPR
mmetsp:Transcript_5760/g.16778  ORF Transcript_5760/g.16778 Transcript_5760/m.16778 type:complete len:248 (-) Transcript_5760:730-1473(-)